MAALSHRREPGSSCTGWTRLFSQAIILETGSSRTCVLLKVFLTHCQAVMLCEICILQKMVGSLQSISKWSNGQVSLLCPAQWKKGMEAGGIGCLRATKGQSTPWHAWKACRFPPQQSFPNWSLQHTVYNKQFIILLQSHDHSSNGLC